MIEQEAMDRLCECIGEEVTVYHVWYGKPDRTQSVLEEVEPFVRVGLKSISIPFVGYGSAVTLIKLSSGEEIYYNPDIPKNYDARLPDDVDVYKRLSFGEEITRTQRVEADEYKHMREAEVAALDKEAKKKGPGLVTAGRLLVKPNLEKEWVKYAQMNTKDFYSAGVIEASVDVMQALSDGKTPEEANEVMTSGDLAGLSGFQAGCVASSVSRFHDRGEEFKTWWNRRFLGEEEATEANGVVNPAILEVRPNT